jgi:putative ABC transport system permease protein
VIRPGIRRAFRLPIWRRDLADQELDEEVRLHLELRAEQLERKGMTPEAARAEARRRFQQGDPTHRTLRGAARRRDDWLKRRERLLDLLRDVRYAWRSVRRSPFFAAGVICTLGLALCAATLVGAVAWRVWLAPMPYPDPERVVRLYEIQPLESATGQPTIDSRRHGFSPGMLEDFRTHDWRTIDVVSEVSTGERRWVREGLTQPISAAVLSPEGYGILGIVPTLGRLPSDTEEEVLLAEEFWRVAFGADPGVIGSTITLGSRSPRIVGVGRIPGGYLGRPQIVEVIDRRGGEDRSIRFIETIARVKPDHTVAQAQAEVGAFIRALGASHPEHQDWGIEAIVLADDLVRPFRGVLVLLLAAGAVFLLLVTVNLVGLVAARRIEGQHDRTIRVAIGASEGRLLRGSVIESVVLATPAAALGVLGAFWVLEPVRALIPNDVPRLADVAITPTLALGVLGAGIFLGTVVGSAGDLISRSGGSAIGGILGKQRKQGANGHRGLVISQVALITLFAAAGVAILHRASTLNAIDLGFEPRGLSSSVITGVREPTSAAEAAALWSGTWRPILAGLEARGIPAALGFNTPMAGEDAAMGVTTLGIRSNATSEEVFYRAHVVSPGYFRTMRIPLLAGRAFEHRDDGSARKVAIVSERFARSYLPAGTPLERMIGRELEPVVTVRGPATVVGVVGSTRHVGPEAPVEPEVYVLFAQQPTVAPGKLLLRGDSERASAAISTVLAQVDPDLRRTPLLPYTSHLAEWFAPLRLQLGMVGALGIVGLVLASLGIYSLLAYQVATRRRELGIRKAVGARDVTLLWGVLAGGGRLVLTGGLIGLAGWYALLPWTRGLVLGIDGAGLLVPLAAALIVGGASLVAVLGPALGAARVDPIVALRAE